MTRTQTKRLQRVGGSAFVGKVFTRTETIEGDEVIRLLLAMGREAKDNKPQPVTIRPYVRPLCRWETSELLDELKRRGVSPARLAEGGGG